MAKAAGKTQAEIPASSLKQLLQQWSALEGGSKQSFAMKLSELIDLSDAFKLSDDLRSTPRLTLKQEKPASDDVLGVLLAERAVMVETVLGNLYDADGKRATSLPLLSNEQKQSADSAEIFQRFYAMQQSEIEFKLVKLRTQLREQLQTHSNKMHQLVTLDTIMHDTLIANTRKLFSVIPHFVAWRFKQFCEQKQQQDFQLFLDDVQQLLLVEIELRLQPLLGLVEAATQE